MKGKVLVTGGAGYMGGWVVRFLLDSGYYVRCLDNLSYDKAAINELFGNPNFEFHTGDICNIRDVTKAVDGMDSVVALAAIVGDPACNLNEKETHSINFESTKVLASICELLKVHRLIFASSCSVYGASDNLILNEGSHLSPVSLYSRTRIMSEKLLLSHTNINTTILRFATLYGQSFRMRYDLVLNFFSAMGSQERKISVHGGDQYRPIVHVQDAATAVLKALDSPLDLVSGEVFNVGSNDQNFTINQLAELAAAVIPGLNVEHASQVVDKRNYRVNFDKIAHLLNFKTAHKPKESMQSMIDNVIKLGTQYKNPIYYNVKYLFKKD
jgi:nucleoside-diphosphate-sugar epimerase